MKDKKTLIICISIGLIVVALGAVAAVSIKKKSVNGFNAVAAQKMDLVESVKATGATKAADAVDLSFEIAGKVAAVPVREGQAVKKGQLLAALSGTDVLSGEKAAAASYESARIALEKLKNPPEAVDLLTAKDSVAKANDDLNKSYDDSFNAMSAALVDFSTVTTGIKSVMYGNSFLPEQLNYDYYADEIKIYDPAADVYRAEVDSSFRAANGAYEQTLSDFKQVTRDSGEEKISAMLDETAATANEVADAAKASKALVDHYRDVLLRNDVDAAIPPLVPIQEATLGGFVTQANADVSSLSGAENNLATANRAVSERTAVLQKLEAGAEDIDIRAAQTRVDAAYAVLLEAQSAVAKTALVAPFDGTVTKVNVAAGEFAGPGVPAVSIISSSGYEAETDVSEIDVAKIKAGTKANVTLDTFGSGETFEATVVSVDSSARIVNGANSYHVVLEFGENDPRFKAGLTANIAFVISEAKGALAVPERSIITTGDAKTVLAVNASGALESRPVTVGIYGDDGFVQILSGLSEGDKVASFGGN
jgi:RND family efflux transporter MFP subunit